MTPPLVLAWERRSPIPREGQRPSRPLFTLAVSHLVERAPRADRRVVAVLALARVGRVRRALRERRARVRLPQPARRLRARLGRAGLVGRAGGRSVRRAPHADRAPRERRGAGARARATHRGAPPGDPGEHVRLGGLHRGVRARRTRRRSSRSSARSARSRPARTSRSSRRTGGWRSRQCSRPRTSGPSARRTCRTCSAASSPRWTGGSARRCSSTPRGASTSWNGRDVLRFTEELRALDLPRRRARGELAARLLRRADAIQADGPRATLLSLAGVVLLVLVAFGLGRRSVRSLADAGWVLASLGVGVLWFARPRGRARAAAQHAELHRPADHVRHRRRLRHERVPAATSRPRALDRGHRADDRRRGGALLDHHHARLRVAARRPEPGALLVRPARRSSASSPASRRRSLALPAVLRWSERHRERSAALAASEDPAGERGRRRPPRRALTGRGR